MKKSLFTFLFILSAIYAHAQSVNGVDLSEIDTEYVQIVGTSKLLSTKVTIELDFGQEDKLFRAKDTQVIDKNGKLMVLNSMIDALNFMTANGYEYLDSYAFTVGNQNVYHYLLRRAKDRL